MAKKQLNGPLNIIVYVIVFVGTSLGMGAAWSILTEGFTQGIGQYAIEGIVVGALLNIVLTLIPFGFMRSILFSEIEVENLGELEITTGEMLICDPFFLKKLPEGTIELKGLNPGNFPLKITLRKKGNVKNIIKAELGDIDVKGERRLLGQIPVVSRTICLVDTNNFKSKFQFQGTERVGMIFSKKHKEIAEKIKEKLELDYIEDSEMTSKFLQSITENLERGIKTFLNQEEKASFFIWTNNTYDQISKQLGENYKPDYTYTNLPLQEGDKENILVFSTMKDKLHRVYGVFHDDKLAKIEINV